MHAVFGQNTAEQKLSEQKLSMQNASEHNTEKLRLLMLDTPQVEAMMGIVKNFENQTGIFVETTTLPHHFIYEAIQKNYQDDGGAPYDVFMYDMPWLPSLASERILKDI